MSKPVPGKNGNKYVPFEERTGESSVVFFTRDLSEDGLKKIRNLGAKSESEIIRSFFTACYCQLKPSEQAVFWQKVLDHEYEQ